MEESLTNYLRYTLPTQDDWVTELERQATIDHVPIMEPVSMHFIMQQVRLKQPQRILEIGTAIGYSALRMLNAHPCTTIVTVEKDETRYQQAVRNILNAEKQDQIKVMYGDAMDVMNELKTDMTTFDLIFIDAAKGQYKSYFEHAHQLLTKNGLIISDNVLFRGYVANPDTTPKKYKKMVEKLIAYNEFLSTHPNFITTIVPIGDGVALSLRR